MPAKFLVVAGPNRGATYFLQNGENIFGRDEGCNVVLSSTQVSKRHCNVMVANDGRKAELIDLGSSNGSFVNGVLVKRKALQAQDKVSIGPFVMQLILASPVAVRPAGFQTLGTAALPGTDSAAGHSTLHAHTEEEPKSLVGRLKKRFDEIVLPVMYSFYEKHDYPTIFVMMFSLFVLLNLGFTVSPVLERTHEEVMREAEKRAIYIANQMAIQNRQAILENKESTLNVDFADGEVNVKDAVIVNLESRIMAPATRLNEMYTNPLLLKYKDQLLKDSKYWAQPYRKIRDEEKEKVTVMVPIMVLSKTKGINVPGAIAALVFSTSAISLDSGTQAAIYFETLTTTAMLGAVFLYLLYQLTFQPIRMLNDELDKALKGEIEVVEKKYKSEVINSLIDTVNSVLSRVPKSGATGDAGAGSMGDQEQMIADSFMRSIEFMASKLNCSAMMIDPELRIKYANSSFEELTGIRGAVGDVIENVSRDESFPSLIKEMMEKSVAAGSDGLYEDYDFNSGLHKIHAVAISGVPGKVEGYLFLFEKAEG